ncbi:hypothetical protein SAMN05216312_105255 [Cohnella sp. OV330]|uniref:hypothetical protein n=1 Tax=Cohnella sp. OV330 TaxID=1855288 RepID=UPI0008E3AA48|nr:hypothetical protein [Cohnella sp. OV330]SFB28773.1 hypothetical protein SAMN05216312_105255 [Cohnella sp. OV330]
MNEGRDAKELFMSFGGSTIRMYRAGEYEAYKAFGASPEEEARWLEELIEGLAGELSIRGWDAAGRLEEIARERKDARALERTVKFAARHLMSADSIVKLMYAEKTVAMLSALRDVLPEAALHESVRTTKVLLDDIVAKPLILDGGHDLASHGLKDKRALNRRAEQAVEALKRVLDGGR